MKNGGSRIVRMRRDPLERVGIRAAIASQLDSYAPIRDERHAIELAALAEVQQLADNAFGPIVVADSGRPRGLALLGMRERAVALGGTVAVASAPRRGMRVSVTLPLCTGAATETSLPDGSGPGRAPA
jgi:signal transduction histidine kinase